MRRRIRRNSDELLQRLRRAWSEGDREAGKTYLHHLVLAGRQDEITLGMLADVDLSREAVRLIDNGGLLRRAAFNLAGTHHGTVGALEGAATYRDGRWFPNYDRVDVCPDGHPLGYPPGRVQVLDAVWHGLEVSGDGWVTRLTPEGVLEVSSHQQTSWLGEIEPMEPILICQAVIGSETLDPGDGGTPFESEVTCAATWIARFGGVRWV